MRMNEGIGGGRRRRPPRGFSVMDDTFIGILKASSAAAGGAG